MGGWVVNIFAKALAAVACVVAAVWLALWYFIPAPPHELTIAAGTKWGGFERIANRYKERLARHHVTLNLRFAAAGESARLVTDPKSGVSAAFLFGGLLTSEKAPDIVSLGRINAAPFWIFYRGAETLDRLTQLKGKRAYVTVATGDLVDRGFDGTRRPGSREGAARRRGRCRHPAADRPECAKHPNDVAGSEYSTDERHPGRSDYAPVSFAQQTGAAAGRGRP
jgi:hypothetical protein